MLEKIKNLIIGARNKVASMSPKIMAVIVGYFIAVVLLVLTLLRCVDVYVVVVG